MDCLQALFFVQISVIFSSGCPEKVRRNHLQTIKEDWKMTDKEKQQIKALRESGESYAQISKMMDLPINSIKTYCRRNNLTSIDVEREDKTSTCLECGKSIEQNPGRKKKKFCSDKCRMLWWNSHSEEVNRKANYSCTCAFCGKQFTSYGNKHRKYCSHSYLTAGI